MNARTGLLMGCASALALGLAAPSLAEEAVAAAPAATTDASAEAAADGSPDIIVTGIRGSLQRSLDVKRNSEAIVDSISAEDIGKFPDINVAESLSHIPGVTVDHLFGEGEKVSILGTDPALNRTLLNGQTVASADWFILDTPGRTFNYTLLAPEVVGRADVYKSPEARIDEGSIGGTVILRTRMPLDLKANAISGSVGYLYNDRADKGDIIGSALYSWKNLAETFGVTLSFQHSKEHIRREGVESYGTVSGADYLAHWSAIGPNGQPFQHTIDAVGGNLTARGPNAIGTSFFQQERERNGGTVAVQYRPTENFELDFNALYVDATYNNFNQSFYAFPYNRAGAAQSLTVKDGIITGGTFYDVAPADCATVPWQCRGQSILDVQDRKSDVKTQDYDLKGTWTFAPGWTASAQGGYTKATGGTKQQYFGEFIGYGGYTYDISGAPDRPLQLTYQNGLAQDPTRWEMDSGWGGNLWRQPTSDQEKYGQIDITRTLDGPLTSVMVGAKYREHETTQEAFGGSLSGLTTSVATIGATTTPDSYLDGFDGATSDMINHVALNQEAFEAYLKGLPLNTGAGGFNGYAPQYGTDFDIKEKIFAAYGQANFRMAALHGNFGLRYVHTDQTSNGWTVDSLNVAAPSSVGKTYDDLLPSLNVAYDLTDKVILRFAAAQVIARPNYSDLSSYFWLSDTVHSGGGGNPDLDPYKSNNINASIEWYFAPNSYLSGEVFYKDIQNYILVVTAPEQHYNVSTNTPNETYNVARPRNAGSATSKGFAVSYQQVFAYGFGLQANYTYSDAQANDGRPLPYNSKHQINISPFWESHGFSVRGTYAWRSKYFTGIDRGDQMYAASYTELDAAASYQITPNVQISVDAANLLDEDYYAYANTPQQPRGDYRSGRRFQASLRVNF